MPRVLTSGTAAAISATYLAPAIFIQIAFASGTVYLWSGVGNATWNSQTWTGSGAMLGFSMIEDAANTEARNVTVTLSGIDATILPDTLGQIQLGLPMAIFVGFQSGGTLIASPAAAWKGRVDIPDIAVGPKTFTIALSGETRIVDMNIPVDRRYTNEDQQMEFPGDLCFQFVNGIQELTFYWGQQANVTNNI